MSIPGPYVALVLPGRRGRSQSPSWLLLIVVAAGLPLSAQDLRPIGPGEIARNRATYDTQRQRIVAVDHGRRTWEEAASQWLVRPAYAPMSGKLELHHAPSMGRTLGVYNQYSSPWPLQLFSFDGDRWEGIATTNTPSGREDASFVWDPVRNQLVMFGGIDGWFQTLLDETWIFDGVDWTLRVPTVRPPGRILAAMAFDRARQRALMVGGYSPNTGILSDTWEWDGAGWTPRLLVVEPSGRYAAAMAYDAVRSRVVLHGGLGMLPGTASELWEFDGSQWQSIAPSGAQPGGLVGHSMVYDERIGEVVLLAGYATNANNVASRQSWSWNGSRWLAQSTLAASPGMRTGAALMAEPGGQSNLLFGGANSQGVSVGDSWRWDGQAWSSLAVAGPSPRSHASTCTTPQGCWLFGGASFQTSILYRGDTWHWNGSAWSQLAVATSPSPRSQAGFAFESVRNAAVLFGGYDGTVHGDTWTFDGTSWQAQNPGLAPAPRFGHAMAYDPTAGVTVLFGGLDANLQPLQDTWVWNGSSWSQRFPQQVPFPTGYCAMQHDPLRGKLVMVTGMVNQGVVAAWVYDGMDWTLLPVDPIRLQGIGQQMAVAPQGRGVVVTAEGSLHQFSSEQATAAAYGTACGAMPPRLSGRTWPTPGAAFGLDCSDNIGGSLVAFALGFASANLPVAGCSLLVAPGQVVEFRLANPGGFAELSLPLPSWSGLLGLSLYGQAANLRPTASAGFALSRGLVVTVGD